MPRIAPTQAVASKSSIPEIEGARFERAGSQKTNVNEASDVVALAGGRFLIVGDKNDFAVIVSDDGKRTKLELPGLKSGHSQLEGVTYDPVRRHLFVVREESRELLRYEWDARKPSTAPVLEKRIDLDGKGPRNKGIEGLSYLPPEVSPTGEPQLLLAKEGNPRELVLIGDGGKGKPLPVHLQREVTDLCRDFSAVTVDPKTGHLFIASDESSAVAQVKLVRDGDKVLGKLVQSFPLRDDKGKRLARVEGLSFNEKGDLFVLTENDGKLHCLKRK